MNELPNDPLIERVGPLTLKLLALAASALMLAPLVVFFITPFILA